MNDTEIANKKYKGLSLTLVIGKYAGFGVVRDVGVRLVLGYISIGIIFRDIESMSEDLLKLMQTPESSDTQKNG